MHNQERKEIENRLYVGRKEKGRNNKQSGKNSV